MIRIRDKQHNQFPTRHELSSKLVAVSALKPMGNATRKHPPAQIRKLGRLINKFGILRPVLADSQLRIIDGAAIVEAAASLGLTELPVVTITDLDEANVRAARLALNRVAEESSWDKAELAREFCGILEIMSDFDLAETAFEMAEIDLSFGDDGRDEEDEFPAPLAGPPVCRVGDLWQLGPHRIVCGDSLVAENYASLLAGDKARLVFTDPPYNVRIADVAGFGTVKHREFAEASGEMTQEEFRGFLAGLCTLLAKFSTDGSLHFICMDWRHVADLIEAGGPAYTELKNVCTWAKPNAGMGSFYRSQTEFICVFKSGKAIHINNIQLGRYGRNRSNLWTYAGQTSVRGKKSKSHLHPTVKPVAMVSDAIMDASNRGDIILDPFGGSGTSLIAAEKTGRQGRLMEIDPAYVDLTIRRYEALTGQPGRLADDGRTFLEIARARQQEATAQATPALRQHKSTGAEG